MNRFKLVILFFLMAMAIGAHAADEPTTATATAKDDLVKTTDTLMPIVKIQTNVGDIVLELDAHKAPISVLNFLRYAKEGYYNDTIFHRVIPTFMIQGGGYYPDMAEKLEGRHDPIANEWQNGLKNEKNTIAMARLPQQPDSATAQFFINVQDNKMLDRPADGAGYAVFGKVVDGFDTVEKIRTADRFDNPQYPGNEAVNPVKPIIINAVTLVSKFDEAVAQKQADAIKAQRDREREEKNASARAMLKDTIDKVEKEAGVKVKTTDSGLMIAIVREGTGDRTPTPEDTVTVNYEGTLTNGHVFDSSYAKNAPITFQLGRLIKGWQEGLGMLKPSGMCYLIVPPELGYGSRDMGDIPPNSWLVFKIELLAIK